MKSFKSILISILISIFIVSGSEVRGESATAYGSITGNVNDKFTGDVLPSVTVEIIGTFFKTTTSFSGGYLITGIPVGKYSVKFSSVGYTNAVVRNVWVSSNLETIVDHDLVYANVSEAPEIVISASKNSVGKLTSGTFHIIDQEDIQILPAENISDLMDVLPGVVDKTYIRGGRSTEIDFLIDGVSISDPLFGGLLRTNFVNTLALKEVQIITGGFNADYGNAMSGVVNLITLDPGPKWGGKFRLKNSLAEMNGYNGDYKLNSRGENLIEFAAGGPSPFFEDKISLFFSGKIDAMNNRAPGLNVTDPLGNNITNYPHNELHQVNLFGKANINVSSTMKLTAGGFFGNIDYEEDSWFWRYNSNFNNLPSISKIDLFGYLRFTHFISSNFYYETSLEYNDNKITKGITDNVNDYNWFKGYTIIPGFEQEIPIDYSNENPYGADAIFVSEGRLDSYWRARSKYIGLNFNIFGKINRFLSIKSGVQGYKYDIKNVFAGNSFQYPSIYEDNYQYKPYDLRTYGKLSFRLKNLNIDAGLLGHFLKSNSSDNTIEVSKTNINQSVSNYYSESKLRLNPRIGIAYQIKEGVILHGNYGLYYQLPTFHSLYASQNNISTTPGLNVEGDIGLEPPRTKAFESGITLFSNDNTSFTFTGYYKKLYNLEDLTTYLETDNIIAEYTDSGNGRIYGFESSFRHSLSKSVSTKFSYSYSQAKGTLSFIDPNIHGISFKEINVDQTAQIFNLGTRESQIKNVSYYLPFDRRHSFKSTINVTLPRRFGFSFKEYYPFEELDAGITTIFQSGTPYSLETVSGELKGSINNFRHPWYTITNMRLSKSFPFPAITFSAFFDVHNVFNRTAPIYNHPTTSQGFYSALLLLSRNEMTGLENPYSSSPAFDSGNIEDKFQNNEMYQRFLKDFADLKLLNQLPREIWFGLQIDF